MALAGHGVVVYLTGTDVAPVAADEVDGINSATFSPARDMLDVTDFKAGDAKKKLAGLKDGSVSLSGDAEFADAPQDLMRSKFDDGGSIWAHIHFDPAGASGSKGYKVECIVESYEVSASHDGKVEFSASLTMNGAPVAV